MNARNTARQFLISNVTAGNEPPPEMVTALERLLQDTGDEQYRKALEFAKQTFVEEQDKFFDLLTNEMIRVGASAEDE